MKPLPIKGYHMNSHFFLFFQVVCIIPLIGQSKLNQIIYGRGESDAEL